MKSKSMLFFVWIIILHSSAWGQEFEWFKKIQQIKLLDTTYDDVIKIVGKPVDGTTEKELAEYFDLKEGRVFVGFASGLCIITPDNGGKPMGWKVPEWTVITVSFTPNKPFNPKRLPFDRPGFRKYPVSDVPGGFVFENDESGISFGTNRKGKVDDVSFDPPSRFDNLRCQ